jgi:carboxylesterase type B
MCTLGILPTQGPVPWLAAYHSGDLPYWFGTYGDFAVVESERGEGGVSEAMQDYLLAFMRDPEEGLWRKGWMEAGSGMLMRFAGREGRMKEVVRARDVDGVCG